MQSARTKQLLILGNRRNRTNDLLRELSSTASQRSASSASSKKRTGSTRERLRRIEPKVDTGLRRRRVNVLPNDSASTSRAASPVQVRLSGPRRDVSPEAKQPSQETVARQRDVIDDIDEVDEENLPVRIKIRKKSVRDARDALVVLCRRPLSPRSVQKFRAAIETIHAQRTLIEDGLLRQYIDEVEKCSSEGELESRTSEIDAVEDYDPAEQIVEEFGSVFGAVAHESRDLLRREKGETTAKDLEKQLLDHYPTIRNIFKFYSSMTKPFDENITAAELGSMALGDWMTFVKDCKLIGPHPKHQMVKSSAELVFIRLNWVTDERGRKVKNQDVSNSDRTLIMPEFICGVLRLAKQCGVQMGNLALTVNHFINDVICKRAHSVDVEDFRKRMRLRSVRAAIIDFQEEIRAVFIKYAAAEAKTAVGGGLESMDLKELMQLCRRMQIVSFNDADRHLLTPLAVQHAFALAQLQVVGEDAGEIDADEFVELISRIAEKFFDVYFSAVESAEMARLKRANLDASVASVAALPTLLGEEVALAWKLRWFFPRLTTTPRALSPPTL